VRTPALIQLRMLPGLLREITRVRRGMARGRAVLPWRLEIFATYSCQSRCKTCLIWTRYQREPELRARELPPEAFARAAASVRSHLRWLSFTGGEITDRQDATELVFRVAEAAPAARVIAASTHGLDPPGVEALFRAVADRFRERAVLVTVSLDGLGETYEAIRGVQGAELALESVARLEALGRTHPNLGASFQVTLSRRNMEQAGTLIKEISARARGNVVTVANDSLVLTEGRLEGVDAREDPRLRAAVESALEELPGRDISEAFAGAYLRLVRRSLPGGLAPIPCVAGFASLTLSPYGEVLQCDRHNQPLGVLEAPDFDLGRVVKGEGFARRLAAYEGCRECFTPCQAYPSMMHAPVRTALLVGRRRSVREKT
jgi:MoaA/NifB/PqqE/SkfB family radical SAM enzyme